MSMSELMKAWWQFWPFQSKILSINQSISQSVNQSISQSFSQLINQSINQSLWRFLCSIFQHLRVARALNLCIISLLWVLSTFSGGQNMHITVSPSIHQSKLHVSVLLQHISDFWKSNKFFISWEQNWQKSICLSMSAFWTNKSFSPSCPFKLCPACA